MVSAIASHGFSDDSNIAFLCIAVHRHPVRYSCHLFLIILSVQQLSAQEIPCSLVGIGPQLRYGTTSRGDRMCDFSYAGYRGGGVALPAVAEKAKVTPGEGDYSDIIQAAIDKVSAMPLGNGLRGAVVLAAGNYKCSKTLNMHIGGVVLRGAGTGATGTVIQMTDTPHPCIVIGTPSDARDTADKKKWKKKKDSSEEKSFPGFTTEIADAYVPSGATSLNVKQLGGLKAGDWVRISRPVTPEWIHFMGMDTMPDHWLKEGKVLAQDREVQSVNGQQIRWAMPLTDCIDTAQLGANRATVQKISPDHNLSECGVENLRIEAAAPQGDWIDVQNVGVIFQDCEDSWVRNVSTLHQLPDVVVGDSSQRITLDSVTADHPATVSKSSRSNGKATDFRLGGRQILMNKCRSSGHGSFYVSTAGPQSMLNVVLNSVFSGDGSIQPHMRWSTSLLLDGCKLRDGEIIIRNRGTMGSGHGWTMGWGVVWNCAAKEITVQQPPGSINWCVGNSGKYQADNKNTQAWLFAKGSPVKPDSLYLAQLRARLGDQAVKAIGY